MNKIYQLATANKKSINLSSNSLSDLKRLTLSGNVTQRINTDGLSLIYFCLVSGDNSVSEVTK